MVQLGLGADVGPLLNVEGLGGVVDVLAVVLSFVLSGLIESEIENLRKENGVGVPECVFYLYCRRHEGRRQLDLERLAEPD